jgi:hypothetical protein
MLPVYGVIVGAVAGIVGARRSFKVKVLAEELEVV